METCTRSFTLQALTAIIRDAEQIQNCQLEQEIDFLCQQKWPEFIRELTVLGKAIEESLITGRKLVVSAAFPLQEGSLLPQFCYSLFSTVFCEDGCLRYSFDADYRLVKDADGAVLSKSELELFALKTVSSAVFLLRQITLAFSKVRDLDPIISEESEIEAFRVRAMRSARICVPTGVLVVARRLLHQVFFDEEGRLTPILEQWIDEPWGRHGPGAVASREKGSEKWNFSIDALRLPRELYGDSNGLLIGKVSNQTDFTSRVCLVPKDLRGRRIICIEPKEIQYAQQGLFQTLNTVIRNNPLTNRAICLERQDLSFWLARKWKRISTIDLKDASDSVSMQLCKYLFPKEVLSLFTRYRANFLELPNGDRIANRNIAFTMGNALCFPVETLVFWSLSLASILTNGGQFWLDELPVTDKIPLIRVFGDDIIVPSEHYSNVVTILRAADLVVNQTKSCHDTFVREACGSWWFCGFDCRITKFKYSQCKDLNQWTSFVDVIAQQRENGMIKLAEHLQACCDLVWPTLESLLSGRVEKCGKIRYNIPLQRCEYLRPSQVTANKRPLIGRVGLTAWFTNQDTCFSYSRAQCRIKYEWVAIT